MTLGEILAAALTAPPAPAYECSDMQLHAGRELSRQLAPALGVAEQEVFDALCTVPNDMLELLHSPGGWSALASFIAADFGLSANLYRPSLH